MKFKDAIVYFLMTMFGLVIIVTIVLPAFGTQVVPILLDAAVGNNSISPNYAGATVEPVIRQGYNLIINLWDKLMIAFVLAIIVLVFVAIFTKNKQEQYGGL